MIAVVGISAIVLAIVALAVLAWWWSGRSRGAGNSPLAAAERGEAESKKTKEYRPSGGFGP